MGLSNIGVVIPTLDPCSMSAPANQTFFSIGMFVSAGLLVPLSVWYPLEGGPAVTTLAKLAKKYTEAGAKEHSLAALGGFLMCTGGVAYNLGNGTQLGPAPTYSIGNSAPLIGILWGSLFFKEFQGTSVRVWGIIPGVVVLFIMAIASLALSG